MKNEDPLNPLIEAIAARVEAILAPQLTQAHAVKPRLLTRGTGSGVHRAHREKRVHAESAWRIPVRTVR